MLEGGSARPAGRSADARGSRAPGGLRLDRTGALGRGPTVGSNWVFYFCRSAAAGIAVRLNVMIGVLRWFAERGMGVHFTVADGDVFSADDFATALMVARDRVRQMHHLASVHCDELGYFSAPTEG